MTDYRAVRRRTPEVLYVGTVGPAQLELSVCPAAKVSPGGTRTALPTAPASRQR